MIMTEFEKWLESGEYKRDTENHKIDFSVEHTDGSYKIEFKNILDFAEVCFNNGIKYKQAKRLLKQYDKFLTSDFNDENLEKDLKTNLVRDIHKLLNLSEE